MKYNDYSEVINDRETYREIAENLQRCNVLIGWTDEQGTHFDILFTKHVDGYGTHRGGIRLTDLFISIMRRGAFSFEIEQNDTHSGYYNEKLGGRMGSTSEKLAELINGVKKELTNYVPQ